MVVNIIYLSKLAAIFLLLMCLNACASNDRSMLTMAGDEFLDCTALNAEMELAGNLGEDAPARRRHIRSLQDKNQCISKPNISITFGYTKFF
jgi:hypothetical protein